MPLEHVEGIGFLRIKNSRENVFFGSRNLLTIEVGKLKI